MRPRCSTGAHSTDRLAELICSNSLGSALPDRASGMLIGELRRCGSLLLSIAERCAVPAGDALAVDRQSFAEEVTRAISSIPDVEILREEATGLPDPPAIVASGPLTSPALAAALTAVTGEEHLFFYDAIAPVVDGETLDRAVVFSASRRGRGELPEGDYLNCPFMREEYERFIDALVSAERAPLREFERAIDGGVRAGPGPFFEGCLPLEVLAARGREAPAFGPLRPVGLRDPRTGRRPYAALQLRREDAAGTRFNLVGCQTNLRPAEQERVFRLVPGLERARFVRFGQMHRNTFVCGPKVVGRTLEMKARPGVWIAGQLAGVEGYLGNIATGLAAAWDVARHLRGEPPALWPAETMIGALLAAVAGSDPDTFQPIKASLGLLPPLPNPPAGRPERSRLLTERGRAALEEFLADRDRT